MIDLEFITSASANDGKYKISGIPDKLWEVFKDAAQKAMPEKGELAWASVLTEIIQKHVIGDVFTYIMTDIPKQAKDALDKVAGQADMSTDHIIGVMFKQAMEGKMHILNMITDGKLEEEEIETLDDAMKKFLNIIAGQKEAEIGYHCIFVAGLSDVAWEYWRRVSATANLAPEELIGLMFEAAGTGSLTLTPPPVDPHNFDFKENVK